MSRNCGSCRIKPLPMVPATLVPNKKAATKLKNAAQMTACVGESTRVETTVAIEFAASWNPLRKSKIRATKTMRKMRVIKSAVLQDNPLQRIADILASVQRLLDVVVQLLPLDHF